MVKIYKKVVKMGHDDDDPDVDCRVHTVKEEVTKWKKPFTKPNLFVYWMLMMLVVAVATVVASAIIGKGKAPSTTNEYSSRTTEDVPTFMTSNVEQLAEEEEEVISLTVESEIEMLLGHRSANENEVITVPSGCGVSIPKSIVTTIYDKLLDGASLLDIEWEDCSEGSTAEAMTLKLPATKQSGGQFFTFKRIVDDDSGSTAVALACDSTNSNSDETICDLGSKVYSDEAPILPDDSAPDDKIPTKISIQLLNPLHEIPAEGDYSPAKKVGLGFVSLLGPDISRVQSVEFKTSFVDDEDGTISINKYDKVTTNIPAPLLFTDDTDDDQGMDGMEYGSVFYGEDSTVKGAYINMIASSSGGNFRALINDGRNGCSVTKVNGIVKYSCSKLEDLVDPEEPVQVNTRRLNDDSSQAPAVVTPIAHNITATTRRLQNGCRNVGGVPSGTWNAGWRVRGQTWDCDYFVKNNMCFKSESYPAFENWIAKNACCGCGGGVSTSCNDLRPSGKEWSLSNGRYKCSVFESWGNWCTKYGSYVGSGGYGAKQACCVCGGGDGSSSGGGDGNTPRPNPPQPTPTRAPVPAPVRAPVPAPVRAPVPAPTPNPPTGGGGGTTCSDERPGGSKWTLSGGRYSCSDFERYTSWCRRYGRYRGTGSMGANDACCACGGGEETTEPEPPQPTPTPPRPSPPTPTPPRPSPPTTPTSPRPTRTPTAINYLVDVLVVYTTEAMNNNPGGRERDMENFITGLGSDTNTALSNSGSTVRINIVGTYHNTQFTKDINGRYSNQQWMNMLTNTNDGNFDYEVTTLRNSLKADFVVLLGEYVPSGLGRIQGEFGVVRRYIADIGAAFAHEVGHMLGALHNIEDNEIYDRNYYDGSNVGYIDRPNCFRTIMSYPDNVGCRNAGCRGGSCSIILYFSNTVATYNGHPTGSPVANNAKYIDSKGSKSVNWK